MTELTRDDVRAAYKASGLSDLPLTLNRMATLRDLINRRMLDLGYMDGTFHMRHTSDIKISNGYVTMRCEAYYFNDREAVSFEPSGFVGFAGWADGNNVQPILRGFTDWMEQEIAAKGASDVQLAEA